MNALKLTVVAAVLWWSAGVAEAASATVPVDVGVGPAAYWFFGPVANERAPYPHFGLKLNVHAIVTQDVIAKNRSRIPKQYQRAAKSIREVRISPSLLIPDSLIISPATPRLGGTGIYGVTWRPVSLGLPLAGNSDAPGGRLGLSAGLLLTYAFLHSQTLPTTHFVRPGVDLALEAEVFVSRGFGLSVGWASQLYVPQQLGSFGVGPLDQSIFHVGQAFLKLHFRFPYTVKM